MSRQLETLIDVLEAAFRMNDVTSDRVGVVINGHAVGDVYRVTPCEYEGGLRAVVEVTDGTPFRPAMSLPGLIMDIIALKDSGKVTDGNVIVVSADGNAYTGFDTMRFSEDPDDPINGPGTTELHCGTWLGGNFRVAEPV